MNHKSLLDEISKLLEIVTKNSEVIYELATFGRKLDTVNKQVISKDKKISDNLNKEIHNFADQLEKLNQQNRELLMTISVLIASIRKDQEQ